jgi:uncharacterized membrane protein YoaK (UPF0700 family)
MMVWGMMFGMLVGVVIGSATGRMGLWLPISMVTGLMLGMIMRGKRKPGGRDDPEAPPPA